MLPSEGNRGSLCRGLSVERGPGLELQSGGTVGSAPGGASGSHRVAALQGHFPGGSGRVRAIVPYPPLRVTNRREVESRSSGLESSEARQTFAGAKAISSDMFFGREVDTEVRWSTLSLEAAGRSGLSALLFGLWHLGGLAHENPRVSGAESYRPHLFPATV